MQRRLTALSLAATAVVQPTIPFVAGLVANGVATSNAHANQTPLPLGAVSTNLVSSNLVSATAETNVSAEAELLAPDNETLKQATDQYKSQDYEEAQTTLSTVKADDLSASDKKAYDRLSQRVNDAVEARKTARADYERGESLRADGKYGQAIDAYKKAAKNDYADTATRTKSLEQRALAETSLASSELSDKAVYAEAREALSKGDYDTAKAKFTTLNDKGFKAGLFQRSPADYLAEIDKKQGMSGSNAMAPAMTPAMTPSGDNAPTTMPSAMGTMDNSSASTPSAKDYYKMGVQQYDAKDYDAAKKSFEAAIAGNYKKGLFERSPQGYLDLISKEQANMPATPAPSAETPAAPMAAPMAPAASMAPAAPMSSGPAVTVDGSPAPAMPAPMTPAPMAPAPAAPMSSDSVPATPTAMTKAEARQAYKAGKDAYNKSDWVEARRQFTLAQDAGYKAGLFEDSPSKWLARLDKKEMAEKAKTDAQSMASAQPMNPSMNQPMAAQPMAAQPMAPAAPAPMAPAAPMAPMAPAPMGSSPMNSGSMNSGMMNSGMNSGMSDADKASKSQELVTQARAAQDAGDSARAADLYKQAAAMDSSNQTAISGLASMQTTGPDDLLTRQERILQARRQVVQYQFDDAIGQAQTQTAQGDFTAARNSLNVARAARNSDPTIFTPAELSRFDTQIANAQTALDRESEIRTKENAETERRNTAALQKQTLSARQTERERTVGALISQAREFISQTKYQEALNVIDQIIAIDPANDYANGVRPLVEDRAIVQQQRRYQKAFEENIARQFNRTLEIRTPYDDLVRFPENWPDINEIRDTANAEARGESATDQATMATLNRTIPELRFDGVPFGDVIDFLRDVTGANIFVEWKALETAGVDRTTPVTVSRLTNIRFQKALETVLREVSAGTSPLEYNIEEGVITISTREQIAASAPRTVVYDVSDLLFRPLSAGDAPQIQFQLEAVNRGGGAGGGGNNLFSNTGSQGQDQTRTAETIIQDLSQLIIQSSPDDWAEGNGGTGTIRTFQTGSSYVLIVSNTRKAHQQLENLLNKLRTSQAVQVSIEARFLQISRSFLEDIGLDIDVQLNRGFANSDKWGFRDRNTGAFTPEIPITQNSSQFTQNPRTGLPTAAATSDPAFQVAATYLDDFGVDFLLRATQTSVNSSIAQAPRITLFSGQRAQVLVGEYQYFITDLNPIIGTNAVAFDPQLSPIFSGVQLWVEAVVSSDRKYVQLNLVPQLRQLTSVQNFVIQAAAGGAGVGGGSGIASGTIQLPTQRYTGLITSTAVPDGGTVLLGGLTTGGEVELEQGVPILSKIPFLKRLFTNRSNAKDEQVVLILVKPTILIMKEVENRQFPLLSNRAAP